MRRAKPLDVFYLACCGRNGACSACARPALKCHHWSNLRPDTGSENSKKFSKLDDKMIERRAVRAYLFRRFFTSSDTMRGNNA